MAISPKDKEFIERLDTEIQKNLQEPTFSIDTLAEIMCMSRSNFYRKIKGISGMSPNDYLKTIRLKMAAELLLQQEYRINEIYELVGFSSSSYFTKCFKEQFGVPPKEFLNNAKNNAGNKSSEIVTRTWKSVDFLSLQSFFTVFSPCPAGYSGQSVHRHFRIQRSGRSGANRQREKLSLSKSKAGIP